MPVHINHEYRKQAVEKLKDLTELYIVVKELIIYFEEVNPEQKSDIQPINELRNAFDHLMRVVAVWLSISERDDSSEYIITHLNKSFGHVYRAGYDTIDFLALTIKGLIFETIKGYKSKHITVAIPDYYPVIRPDIEDINKNIAKFRAQKDVSENNANHLISYIKSVKNIVTYYQEILKAIPALDELENEAQKDKELKEKLYQKSNFYDWAKRLIIGFILILIGYFFRPIITPSTNISLQSPNSSSSSAKNTSTSNKSLSPTPEADPLKF